MEHGEIFQRDIPAVFEADSFVAYSRQTAFFTGQSLAIDQSRTADGDIFQTDSPDERVLPVTVSEVLIFIMLVGLCQVISFLLARESGDDACALFQIEMDVAFQPDGITGIFSGRKPPPSCAAASMARLMAGESIVFPSAFAPKSLTL